MLTSYAAKQAPRVWPANRRTSQRAPVAPGIASTRATYMCQTRASVGFLRETHYWFEQTRTYSEEHSCIHRKIECKDEGEIQWRGRFKARRLSGSSVRWHLSSSNIGHLSFDNGEEEDGRAINSQPRHNIYVFGQQDTSLIE